LFLTPSEQLATRIGSVLPDTPAAAVAMPVGDKIVSVDGQPVQTWEEINYRLANRMGEAGTIAVGVQTYNDSLAERTANATQTYNLPVSDFMQGADKGKDAISSLGAIPWQPEIAPIIGDLTPEGAASRQGMQIGDRITAINGRAIDDWVSATRIIKDSPEQLLKISVLRDGQPVTLEIMPQGKKDTMGNQYGQIGAMVVAPEITVPDAYKTTVEYSPAMALVKSFQKTEQLAVMTVASMGKMITGKIGIDNLSGPITIAKVAKQSFDISWEMVLSTAALISLSLAVLNLLPIPVLDGGHILYYAIELIRGKPVSEQMQIVGMNIGLILMAGFMILAIGNDISRLF
jgi:regulator of sigma E protease